MKKPLFSLFILGMLCWSTAKSQNWNRLYWYDINDLPVQWYPQKDMYAFRLSNGQGYISPFAPSVVTDISHRDRNTDKINILTFVYGTPDTLKDSIRNVIRGLGNYECEYDVITQEPNLPASAEKWTVVDDIVLVTFTDPHFSQQDLQQFMQTHGLSLYRQPPAGLSGNASHCYQFKLNTVNRCLEGYRAIDVAREIWQTEEPRIIVAEPNALQYAKPHTNDPLYHSMWSAENTGQTLVNNRNGSQDADCDLDLVWAQGIYGQGTRICVIDFFGFDLLHEDMAGKFVDGWDAVNNVPLQVGNQIGQREAHGMCVSGIIGAHANNNKGISGVAMNCEIQPICVSWTSGASPSDIVTGLQKAQTYASNQIFNMSWGANWSSGSIQNELVNAYTYGRPISSTNSLGMVLIASAGNSDVNVPNYPAAYPECISVIASNPEDFRKRSADNWDFVNWGSNFGTYCDVAAPGCLIPSTDHSGSDGYNNGDYYSFFNGTSSAAPLVSGVAALILQNNPGLTQEQVRKALRIGADKVHPSLYDYNAYTQDPGRSMEMAFGRVNAFNSIALTTERNEGQSLQSGNLKIISLPEREEIRILIDEQSSKKIREFSICDMLGRELYRIPLEPGSSIQTIHTGSWSKAVYLGTVIYQDGSVGESRKFVTY